MTRIRRMPAGVVLLGLLQAAALLAGEARGLEESPNCRAAMRAEAAQHMPSRPAQTRPPAPASP